MLSETKPSKPCFLYKAINISGVKGKSNLMCHFSSESPICVWVCTAEMAGLELCNEPFPNVSCKSINRKLPRAVSAQTSRQSPLGTCAAQAPYSDLPVDGANVSKCVQLTFAINDRLLG